MKEIFQNTEVHVEQEVQIHCTYFNRHLWDARQILSEENLSIERLNPGD